MRHSIRYRLLIILLSSVSLTWGAGVVASYFGTIEEEEEVFDAQLAQSAKVLLSLFSIHLEERNLYLAESALPDVLLEENIGQIDYPYEKKLLFQIWSEKDQRVILRSASAPSHRLSTVNTGFTDILIDDQHWRIFSISDSDHGIQVQVGSSHAMRGALASEFALRAMLPMLATLPIITILIWFATSKALRPVYRLAREVKSRSPLQLRAVEANYIPTEIRPLVDALNSLFDRLQTVLENERRFTTDAAHELRTPLTGLKTQAEVALRANNEPVRQRALKYLVSATDRLGHITQQLLTLARLDPETGITDPETIRPGTLVSELVAELSPQALEKQIEISVTDRSKSTIEGHPAAVGILIRNLVDNAIRYTPIHGTVEVGLRENASQLVLTVADNGPGIPDDEQKRVLERFYRQPGNIETGSGLGLSIVQRIAELHQASLEFRRSSFGGLEVVVAFPLKDFSNDATPKFSQDTKQNIHRE